MGEAVRLVIWDLDETFWLGTFSEEGIKAYIQRNHDIVVELAYRGIISSICSKNDREAISRVLQEKGIADYFVFTSIDWQPKGFRVKKIIELMQLRPASVLFIDDNPNNLAEAQALVPELQVADENFLDEILSDARFAGKRDPELSRLKHYKVLEERAKDLEGAVGGNENFLRNCDIKVSIEYNVESNLDRAIELINRTNQLNFTKRRLSDDAIEARAQLLEQIRPFDCRAGLVHVSDRYGDYGFVGFFLTYVQRNSVVAGASNTRLIHFCFSCRTLGMLIEKWVYEFLGRPELMVNGDVLTDLSTAQDIDWVKLTETAVRPTKRDSVIAPEIVVFGGCEAHIISGYLAAYAGSVSTFGNYASNGLFTRLNNGRTLLEICDRSPTDYKEEAEKLGLPLHLEAINIFESAKSGAIFVVNLTSDAIARPRVSHKVTGWTVSAEPRQLPDRNLFTISEQELLNHINSTSVNYSPDQRDHLLRAGAHVRQNYELLPPLGLADRIADLRELISRVPRGGKMIIALNHDEWKPRGWSGEVERISAISSYKEHVLSVARDYPYVGTASVSDVLRSTREIVDADHYSREVYLRFAGHLISVSSELAPRSDVPAHKPRVSAAVLASALRETRESEAVELVHACYRYLLRREPDPHSRNFIRDLTEGRLTPGEMLHATVISPEFLSKWEQRRDR